MVDSGTINSDIGNITSKLESYISQISGLSGNWKGDSHDKLVEQANSFKDEYSSALEAGLTSFATACDKYKEYEQLRNEIKDIESQISSASSDTDTSGLENDKSNKVDQCDKLRDEIASALSSASSPKLEATKLASSVTPATGNKTDTTTTATPTGGNSQASEDMINKAMGVIGTPWSPSGYNWTGDPSDSYFTCSGLVDYALGRPTNTSCPESLRDEIGVDNLTTDVSKLKRGDLVFYEFYGYGHDDGWGHVGIYLGDNQIVDSSGEGVQVRDVNYMTLLGGGTIV